MLVVINKKCTIILTMVSILVHARQSLFLHFIAIHNKIFN